MNKTTLNQQLDNYFKILQQTNLKDMLARQNLALAHADFATIDNSLREVSMTLAKAEAYGQDTDALREQCASLSAKRLRIAEKYHIDLQIHCNCDICHDSGYVNGTACICRQKKYIQLLKENCAASRLGDFTFADNAISTMLIARKSTGVDVNNSEATTPPVNDSANCNDASKTTLQLQPTRQSKLFESLYSMMQRFCNKFDTIPLQCILLMGEVGIGKSSLATATANELMNKGKIVLYFTAFEINNIFLKHHIANANIDDLTFESIFDCDFLIIDDLGTEPLYNNISLQYFFSIVDSRILNKKKTMICTNLSIDKFVQRYGERAFSRLTDKRYALPLDYIVGDDLRKIKK